MFPHFGASLLKNYSHKFRPPRLVREVGFSVRRIRGHPITLAQHSLCITAPHMFSLQYSMKLPDQS